METADFLSLVTTSTMEPSMTDEPNVVHTRTLHQIRNVPCGLGLQARNV